MDPDNNLVADYYDPSVYQQVPLLNLLCQAALYAGLFGFVAGFLMSRFIGLEMVGVVQLAFLGLIAVEPLHPLLAPILNLSLINGINSMFSSDQARTASTVPNRLSALQYESTLAYDLNYSLAIILVPMLVGAILFIASKIIKARSEQLKQWALRAVCEYELTVVLFLLYHATAATAIFAMYFNNNMLAVSAA